LPNWNISRGFLFLLFTGRNSEAAMGRAVDIILIKKNKTKKVRTYVRTDIYINFDPKWIKKRLGPLEKPIRMTDMCISLICMSVN
jgi:hypothetical protein